MFDGRSCCRSASILLASALQESRDVGLPAWVDTSLQPSQRGPWPELEGVLRVQRRGLAVWLDGRTECVVAVSELPLHFLVVGALVDVLLCLRGVAALGTLDPRGAVVHMRVPGVLACQSREVAHELLVSERSHVGIAAVGDLPALLPPRHSPWLSRPLLYLQDERHHARGLDWPVWDCVDLVHQLLRGDRLVLFSEEAARSPWDHPPVVQQPERCPGWGRH